MRHASGYQSSRFEIPERSGQHSLGDTAQPPPQLPVPMGLFAKVGQNRHGPLADVNRGDRLRSWCGWVVHISQPVLSIFFFAKCRTNRFRRVEPDANGFLSFALPGTQVYLIDAAEF